MSLLADHSTAFCIKRDPVSYPDLPPFHPVTVYPEYAYGFEAVSDRNEIYDMVRCLFRDMALDRERFGRSDWNPLGAIIRPGQTVLIKPNLVMDRHPKGNDIQCLITHGSVVRPVLDYVRIALRDQGRVIIGDSPLQGTDFEAAGRFSGIGPLIEWYKKQTSMEINLVDFRQVISYRDRFSNVRAWKEVPGDPAGYVEFDLADDSLLTPISGSDIHFRVSKYKAEETRQYHGPHSHRYVITGSVLDADVIISIPKMKTHCKAGVTLGLKNFVGIVGRKQCLAHHREGGPSQGGDEYPVHSLLKKWSDELEDRIDGHSSNVARWGLTQVWRVVERLLKMYGRDPVRDGGWHGNDTVWRMVLDLVRIVRYGRRDGTLADVPQRVILTLIDGILAGEREGPLEATPKKAGCIVAGLNPVTIDILTATLMGLDYQRIPLLREALGIQHWPLAGGNDVTGYRLTSNGKAMSLADIAGSPHRMNFEPAVGWVGNIELKPSSGITAKNAP